MVQRCSPRQAGEGKRDGEEPQDREDDRTENERPEGNEQASSKLVSEEETIVRTVLKLKEKLTDICKTNDINAQNCHVIIT